MPTYVYKCKECGHRFEIFQSFSAEALHTCPECREVALRKVLFPAGVVFKGSGFYVNDSRSTHPKPSTKDSEERKDGKKPADDKASASSNGSAAKDTKNTKKEPAKSGAEKDR